MDVKERKRHRKTKVELVRDNAQAARIQSYRRYSPVPTPTCLPR